MRFDEYMQGMSSCSAKLETLIGERAAVGGLQLSEGINKQPEGIEAGGIAW